MSKPTRKIQDLRQDYRAATLTYAQAHRNPLTQFHQWFDEAQNAQVPEPNAMTLATATPDGIPSARIVLLKGFDKKGFLFYTNYDSQKSQEMLANPNVSLVFCWLDLQRQIRIQGKVEKISTRASKKYFQSRPKGSQIGAWTSPQSQIIANDRSDLEARQTEIQARFKDEDALPLPPNWGGFRVIPSRYEFWQGRTSRLHDRIVYEKIERGWKKYRVAP